MIIACISRRFTKILTPSLTNDTPLTGGVGARKPTGVSQAEMSVYTTTAAPLTLLRPVSSPEGKSSRHARLKAAATAATSYHDYDPRREVATLFSLKYKHNFPVAGRPAKAEEI